MRHFRKLRGLTQQDVARALHISFQQIQKYESGTNKISFERLHRLSLLFEVPLTAWLAEVHPVKPFWESESRQALLLLQAFHGIGAGGHARRKTGIMNPRLMMLLESLMLNVRVINGELERLSRTEQFTAEPQCADLVKQLRAAYLQGMDNLSRVERHMTQRS